MAREADWPGAANEQKWWLGQQRRVEYDCSYPDLRHTTTVEDGLYIDLRDYKDYLFYMLQRCREIYRLLRRTPRAPHLHSFRKDGT